MDESNAIIRTDAEGQALATKPADRVAEWSAQLDADISSRKISSATAQTYRRGLRKFTEWMQGQAATGALPDRKIVRAWVDELSTAKKEDGAPLYSPNSITAWLGGVRAFFSWMVECECIASDPTANITVAGRSEYSEGHAREGLTLDEVGCVLRLASLSARDKALIVLALYTGARGVELNRADIEDLKTVSGETVLYIQGKGRRFKNEFLVIAHADARAALRGYLAELAQAGHKSGPLFVTERKFDGKFRRISSRTLRLIVYQAFEKAGITQKSTHCLRHTAIQRVVDLSNDTRAGQRLARHKRLETTEIYAKNRKRVENAPEKIISYAIGKD